MSRYFKTIIDKLLVAERSPQKLTRSCCWGIFLACAPFLGIQTLLALVCGIVMNVNTKVVVIVLFAVNNPFTMVPIVIADCLTGALLVERLLGISIDAYLPCWLSSIDRVVTSKMSVILPAGTFSFGTYLVGGLIFAIVCSVPLYPVLYRLFKKLLQDTPPHNSSGSVRTTG